MRGDAVAQGDPENAFSRTEYGHDFLKHEIGFWYNETGNPVQIFPATVFGEPWWVVVPNQRRFQAITGANAERRAFSVAVGFIEQQA